MSLRFKSLIAVVLLVGVVTGAMGLYVRVDWEQRERQRIQRDLRRDAEDLRKNLEVLRDLSVSQMALHTRREDFRRILRGSDDRGNVVAIAKNFTPFIDIWVKECRPASSEPIRAGGFVALDNFDLEDSGRAANLLISFGELAIVDFKCFDFTEPSRHQNQMISNEKLQAFLNEQYLKAEDKLTVHSEVFTADGSVWLVFISPLYKDAREDELVGLASVYFELSSQWLAAVKNEGRHNEINSVKHVIYSGDFLSGQSVGNQEIAHQVIQASHSGSTGEFEVDLNVGGQSARHVGIHAPLVEGRLPHLISLKDLDKELIGLRNLIAKLKFVGILLGLAGTFVAYILALRVVKRLEKLRSATHKIQQGNFEVSVKESGQDEVSALARSFNRMTDGLKALRLYTDPVIAKQILESENSEIFQGKRFEGVVLFSDITNFTTIGESMDPAHLVDQLNEYFSAIGNQIKEEGGYLDKFIGDAVMAWWGPPFYERDDLATVACCAALSCQAQVLKLNTQWSRENKPIFETRIGMTYGEVVVGNLGSESKKNFTVVGDTVNLSNRLEGANKLYQTGILVDEEIVKKSQGICFREIDAARMKGRQRPVKIYECVSLASDSISTAKKKILENYEEALKLYRQKKFLQAIQALTFGVEDKDGASLWLTENCQQCSSAELDDQWEAVTHFESK